MMEGRQYYHFGPAPLFRDLLRLQSKLYSIRFTDLDDRVEVSSAFNPMTGLEYYRAHSTGHTPSGSPLACHATYGDFSSTH